MAQQPHHPAHFTERFPSACLDGRHRPPGTAGIGVQNRQRALSLHDHDAHVMADHVVQVAGDPGPLRRGRHLGGQRSFALQMLGPGTQLVLAQLAGTEREADHPYHGEQYRGEPSIAQAVHGGVEPVVHGCSPEHDHEANGSATG